MNIPIKALSPHAQSMLLTTQRVFGNARSVTRGVEMSAGANPRPINWLLAAFPDRKSFIATINQGGGNSQTAGFSTRTPGNRLSAFRVDRYSSGVTETNQLTADLGISEGQHKASSAIGKVKSGNTVWQLSEPELAEFSDSLSNFDVLKTSLLESMKRLGRVQDNFLNNLLGIPPRF